MPKSSVTLFNDSDEAMTAFVGAVMIDLARFLQNLSATNPNDSLEFYQNYRNLLVEFSQQVTSNASLLKCQQVSSQETEVQTDISTLDESQTEDWVRKRSRSDSLDSSSATGSSGLPSNKRRIHRISGPKRMLRFEQTAILRGIYAKQPFLTPEERTQLARQLDLTPQQIWFQNRRFKDKVKYKQIPKTTH